MIYIFYAVAQTAQHMPHRPQLQVSDTDGPIAEGMINEQTILFVYP